MVKKILVKDFERTYERYEDIEYLIWLIKSLPHYEIKKLIKITEHMDDKYNDTH